MRTGRLILLLLLGIQTGWGRPAQVILFRHAEKPTEEWNVHLSPKGEKRARALVEFLTTNPVVVTNGLPGALFATEVTARGHGQRPGETLEPLAKHLKLPILSPFEGKEYAALAKHILRNAAYDGKTVVVCWVHDSLPELAAALGIKPKPAPWKGNNYDRVWVIRYAGDEATLTTLRQDPLSP